MAPFSQSYRIKRSGLCGDRNIGVEHIYEAIVESPYADRPYAYDYLTRNIDYLFDEQKHKALKKFWDCGLRVQPKVNPG